MRNIKFTRSDLTTDQKLESLLRKIIRDLESAQSQSVARISALQARLAQVESRSNQTASNISAIEGAFARAFATSPSGVAVWDEQTNRWISTTDASGTQEGLVTTGNQSFSGNKTFLDSVTVVDDFSVGGDATFLTDITVEGVQYFDNSWRFTYSDSHLNVEYRDGTLGTWGIKGTFIP